MYLKCFLFVFVVIPFIPNNKFFASKIYVFSVNIASSALCRLEYAMYIFSIIFFQLLFVLTF